MTTGYGTPGMEIGGGRVPSEPGSREPSPSVSAASGFDPSRDVNRVISDIKNRFDGSLFSNGVAALLVHASLPEHFDYREWEKWTFRPSQKAFGWAHDRGLIVPWKHSGKWAFTPLGVAVSERLQAMSRDSDRSGEAGETGTGSTVGESAVPKAIAQTSEVNND